MTEGLKRTLFIISGGVFFIVGLIGVFLPVLPTTPFMILAAGCFAESSPRFHRMLLNNRWFGEELRQWENSRTMKRATKKRATGLIILTFSITMTILWDRLLWQLILLTIAVILLFFLWRVPEHS